MRDEECVAFLQWALPRLRMRWPGFRKVRGQVCKRLQRRIGQLELEDVNAYRDYLGRQAEEWHVLDAMARVTISRFYRDQQVFSHLIEVVLPALAQQARERKAAHLAIWSLGAGAGEEPYTLAIAWHLQLQEAFPDLRLRIVASEVDTNQCRRAREACYPHSSLKDLPADWLDAAFARRAGHYCLQPEFRRDVEFREEDIRESAPPGPFDLVLCRNLVFTYFDGELQLATLKRMEAAMRPGAALALGTHEQLPEGATAFRAWDERRGVYRLNPVTAPD